METGESQDALFGGRYRLGPVIGRGGMADVYDGVDMRLDRPVAIKVLRPEMAAQSYVRQRFREEARAAARLSNPNVVAVFDTGEEAGRPYIVMERLPGETLADRIRNGPVGAGHLLQVAGDVLAALAAAHAEGIVHRDVKPENILIGTDGRAKVADFGIAKVVEAMAGAAASDASTAAAVATTTVLIGTPAYLAPERLDGAPATVASDLWALGVVLYEALAGARPFTGATPLAIARAVDDCDPVPLERLRPDLSPALTAAVGTAMAREPSRRFSSARDMAEALGLGSPAGAVEGVPALRSARSRRRGRGRGYGPRTRRRRLAGGALVVVAALVAVAAIGAARSKSSPRAGSIGLAHDLRARAGDLKSRGASAGPAAREVVAGLESVARSVDAGGGAIDGQDLATKVQALTDAGQLTPDAAEPILSTLSRIPGVTVTTSTTTTTTTIVLDSGDEGGNGRAKRRGQSGGGGGGGGGGD